MKTIALCMNSKELQEGFDNPEVCSKFHGAGFLPHLLAMATSERSWVISGARAINQIKAGGLDPKSLLILQEDMCPQGFDLINLGATPQLVFSLESPLYVPDFYDHLSEIDQVFKRTLLFDGGDKPIHFPSFDASRIGTFDKPKTEELCMISSNKQWWSMRPRFDSASWCQAIKNELHTERLIAIVNYPEMHLYGHGWDRLENLPPHFTPLRDRIPQMWKGAPADKLETLAKYDKAICFENIRYPGYMTEKLVHCILTNTKPFYQGCESEIHFEIPPHFRLEDYSHEAFAKTLLGLVLNS